MLVQETPRIHQPTWLIAKRYPRLLKCMRWAAILSYGEAECAIRDYLDGYRGPGWGGEAVAHFGGPTAVIQAAIRCRHIVLQGGRDA